jgi:hypothetical protein
MLTIDEIVGALKISRSEFGNCFLQAQINHSVRVEERELFEAVTQEADNAQAFATALTLAQTRGWLDTLVRLIDQQGLAGEELSRRLFEEDVEASNDPRLQGMANRMRNFGQPDVRYRGIGDAMRWTVKILIKGNFGGTGVLIGPNLVLTAWHVVEELFDVDPGLKYKPRSINAPDLAVEFDDVLRGNTLRPNKTTRIPAHPGGSGKEWCVVFSACHPLELKNQLPEPLTNLNNFWDYAIIRLAETPGLERRWASFGPGSAVPIDNDDMILFQHPAGQTLKDDSGALTPLTPPDPNAIPKLRFLHGVNAVGGSSGGPCFDRSFALFGLHQGEWTRTGSGPVINRGIPLVQVFQDLTNQIGNLPPLDPAENPVWHLGGGFGNVPVIGCDDFQASVWRSALTMNPRLFIITSDNGRLGKSFRLDLLNAMLPDGGNLKINLDAGAISNLPAADLAAKICEGAGVTIGHLEQPDGVNSTPAVWLKDEVLAKIITALDTARAGRIVWITIKDLNKFLFKDSSGSQLLFLLYDKLLATDWLRIVLDGMDGDISLQLRSVREDHVVSDITDGDLETYINRYLTSMRIPADPGLYAAAEVFLGQYRRSVGAQPIPAMNRLLESMMELIEIYAKKYL